jgi:phage baseplate assembly protein W
MAVINRVPKKEKEKQITYYSDFDSTFKIDFNRNDISLNFNEDAVKRSIKNIILTNRGERFFNPFFGCGLNNYLFEPMNPVTQELIKKEIETSIKDFEPRANLLDVVVTPYYDQNGYVISVVFNTINIQTPVMLEFLVTRIR